MCMDFTDLNKCCPKDDFLQEQIKLSIPPQLVK
jgi:hypothetical protein